jgi:hypothetical protein
VIEGHGSEACKSEMNLRQARKIICVALGVFIALSSVSALLLAFNFPANAQERPRTARIGILRVDARNSPAAVEAIQDLKQGAKAGR